MTAEMTPKRIPFVKGPYIFFKLFCPDGRILKFQVGKNVCQPAVVKNPAESALFNSGFLTLQKTKQKHNGTEERQLATFSHTTKKVGY